MTKLDCTAADWAVVCDPFHYDTLSTIVAGPVPKKKKRDYKGTPQKRELSHQMIIQVGGNADIKEQEANTRMAAASVRMFHALEELVVLVEEMRAGRYTPDSFTTQPAQRALASAHKGWTLEEAMKDEETFREKE